MLDGISEKFRPRLHFSANSWINDPNGLIYSGGRYHAFFQCDPDSLSHGLMHWGHASTADLVNWTLHDVALYPDENGACFSGSAIRTRDGDIKLFYTSHRLDKEGRDFQQQCLVHADAGLSTFDKDSRNPVIRNNGLECFRDPKVFWHEGTGRWIMALTHGQSIGFHSSSDLHTWRFESAFGADQGRHGAGPWECPDLLPLTAPDGTLLWVLIVGIGDPAFGPGSGTMYFIGRFDGHAFTNSNPPDLELWLDYGRDYYAAQSFFGVDADRPLVLAWANNWKYARQPVTKSFNGVLSLPRRLKLHETAVGLRLGAFVPESVSRAFIDMPISDIDGVPLSGTYRLHGKVSLGPRQSARLTLFGEPEPQFVFTRDSSGSVTLRQRRRLMEGRPEFGHDYVVPIGDLRDFDLEVFVDNGVVELNVDRLVWSTNVYYPDQPACRPGFEIAEALDVER